MPSRKQRQTRKARSNEPSSKPVTQNLDTATPQQTHPTTLAQRARLDPGSLTASDMGQLQRIIGNQAVGGLLAQTDQHHLVQKKSIVQRHSPGAELQDKDSQTAEIGTKEQTAPETIASSPSETPSVVAPETMTENATVAPAATRSKAEEKTDKKAGKEAGKAFKKSQKLTPGAMSLASAEKILQGSYGGFKKIVPGTVVILANQAACSAKYDEVCMADGITRPDGSPWKAGDCALDDAAAGVQTEGFAWKGVVYVNGETTLVTATAHEILHNNTGPQFRAKAGETFNEGVTETLARKALKAAGVKVPGVTAYPAQVKLTEKLIDFVGLSVVEAAYFGDVQGLIDAYEAKGAKTWLELVQAAEALDDGEVKKALKRKKKTK